MPTIVLSTWCMRGAVCCVGRAERTLLLLVQVGGSAVVGAIGYACSCSSRQPGGCRFTGRCRMNLARQATRGAYYSTVCMHRHKTHGPECELGW